MPPHEHADAVRLLLHEGGRDVDPASSLWRTTNAMPTALAAMGSRPSIKHPSWARYSQCVSCSPGLWTTTTAAAVAGASWAQTSDGGGLHKERELRRPVHAAPQGHRWRGCWFLTRWWWQWICRREEALCTWRGVVKTYNNQQYLICNRGRWECLIVLCRGEKESQGNHNHNPPPAPSVAAKIDFTVDSIIAAGKLSNLGDIESTPIIFDITGHFVPEYQILALKIGRSLFALLESILPGDHKPLISNLCPTSYVGIQNRTMYSFFAKPTVNDSHSRIKSPIHRHIR